VLATGDAAQADPHPPDPPARSARPRADPQPPVPSAPRPRPALGIAAFTEGLTAVLGELAEQIVRDGEGASHLIRLRVTGARTVDEAVALGRATADSVLVRTAFAGGDPNWGRVLAAMGASHVPFSPGKVEVRFGPVTVCRFGVGASFDHGLAASVLARPEIDVTVELGLGEAEATVLTSDLTHGYVTINAEYTT
jgi:glutamate N-acetyltransferase/amino-acid N-acetyltransferase